MAESLNILLEPDLFYRDTEFWTVMMSRNLFRSWEKSATNQNIMWQFFIHTSFTLIRWFQSLCPIFFIVVVTFLWTILYYLVIMNFSIIKCFSSWLFFPQRSNVSLLLLALWCSSHSSSSQIPSVPCGLLSPSYPSRLVSWDSWHSGELILTPSLWSIWSCA